MKEFKRTGKKVLSVFLAALMVMTAWVFVAPEAKAATAGNYYIEVSWEATNGNNIESSYNGKGKSTNDGAGFTISYKRTNGTSNPIETKDFDLQSKDPTNEAGGNAKSSGRCTLKYTCPGFPIEFYAYLNDNRAFWDTSTKIQVYSIKVGSDANNLTTVWSGTMQIASTNKEYAASVNIDGTAKVDWFKKHDDTYVKNGNWANWKYPEPDHIAWNDSATKATVPDDSTTVSVNTSSATVYDRYNVEWYQEPKYVIRTTASANTASESISGITLSTEASTMADTTTLKITNAAKDWVSNGGNNYQRDVYINAWLGSAKSSQKKVTITNCQYTATFVDRNGKTLKTQNCYYNYTVPTAPSIDSFYYDSAVPSKHYEFNDWNPATGKILVNTTFRPLYNANDHDFSGKDTSDDFLKSEADCTTAKTYYYKCSVCGLSSKGITDATYTVGDPLGHDYSGDAATCTTDQKCVRCEAVLKPALGHEWIENTDVSHLKTAATCLDKAVYYKSCSRCHINDENTSFEFGDPLGHDLRDDWKQTKAPTCTSEGSETRSCHRDNCTYSETRSVAIIPHSWDDGKETKAPSCEEAGVTTYTCTKCGATRTEAISPTGHTFNTEYTVDKEPTCTEEGEKSIHCAKCDAIMPDSSKSIPAKGHDFEWVIDRDPLCWRVGLKHEECTVCKFKQNENTEIEKTAHTPGEWTVTTAPTCTEKGVEKKFCTVEECKEELDSKEIPANGHNFEWVIDREPLCWRVGLKHEECTVCHLKQNENTEIDKVAHTPSDWIIRRESTCTEHGIKSKNAKPNLKLQQQKNLSPTLSIMNTWMQLVLQTVMTETDARFVTEFSIIQNLKHSVTLL